MKRILRVVAIIIGVLVIGAIAAYLYLNEPLPNRSDQGSPEILRKRVNQRLNFAAYDNIALLKWNFAGVHQYIWDKKQHLVSVAWDDYLVKLNTKSLKARAWHKDIEIRESAELTQLKNKAWSYFCNDSWWLIAAYKLNDPSAALHMVESEDRQLLATYSSGGTTPGDSYLWIIDEDGLPVAYKMWVSIIPIGGIRATWEDWQEHRGAWFATKHRIFGMNLEIKDIVAAQNYRELGLETDYFDGI